MGYELLYSSRFLSHYDTGKAGVSRIQTCDLFWGDRVDQFVEEQSIVVFIALDIELRDTDIQEVEYNVMYSYVGLRSAYIGSSFKALFPESQN